MLKILVVNDVFPHINNRTTIFFRNIVPMLEKKFEIKICWVITDDYGEKHRSTNTNYEIFLMSDFKNAIDACEKIKPDIIYHLIGWHVVDYAFIIAKKILNIPSFGYADGYDEDDHFAEQDSKLKIRIEQMKQFFEIKDAETKNKVKKNRGMNFIKKILFLLKTIRATKKSYMTSVLDVIRFLRSSKPKSAIGRYSEFSTDLIFAENERQIKGLIKWGLKKENIIVVGNPAFDNAFEKRECKVEKTDDKLNVLFITVNISGLQGKSNWSKLKRNEMIREVIDKCRLNQKISLTIKIHPTSENYSEYKKLLEPYKEIHLFQTEDIVDLLVRSDVVITPCTTTAGVIALIMKKPIIIWNYFQVEEDLFLRKKVVKECKDSSELHDCINEAETFRKQNEEKINELIKQEFVDGNASQRIVNELEKWLKSKQMA